MPLDKALDRDGFNEIFIKNWSIVLEDIFKLCDNFYLGKAEIENFNWPFSTLAPKEQSSENVLDYRPISLTNL